MRLGKETLYLALRPNVLALVESSEFSDSTLKTLIGCQDGEVYNRLYDYAANKNTINTNKDPLIALAR